MRQIWPGARMKASEGVTHIRVAHKTDPRIVYTMTFDPSTQEVLEHTVPFDHGFPLDPNPFPSRGRR